MMFVPFFLMGDLMLCLQGLILFLTGPMLAAYISPNLQEQVFSLSSFLCIDSFLSDKQGFYLVLFLNDPNWSNALGFVYMYA
jgi:hypothetical protein